MPFHSGIVDIWNSLDEELIAGDSVGSFKYDLINF
jgi:hypothetical protein